MNEHATPPTRLVSRTVRGNPQGLMTYLSARRDAGQLVRVNGSATPLDTARNMWELSVTVVEPIPAPANPLRTPRKRVSSRIRRTAYTGAIAVGTAALSGLVYAVYCLAVWVMAHLVAIVGAAVALLILCSIVAYLVGGGSHCPGCRG